MSVTESDIEMIQRINELNSWHDLYDDPTDDPPDRSGVAYSVSESLCRAIRDYFEEHSYTETAEYFGLGRTTVETHIAEECTHESLGIDSARCAVIRSMVDDGWSYRSLGDRFNVTHGTIRYHVTGQCSCAHDVPATAGTNGTVTRWECRKIRRLAVDMSYREIADKIEMPRTSIQYHASERCSHG